MSFYCVIQTKISNKKHLIAALTEMRRRGELSSVEHNERKETFDIDRDGDKLKISQNRKSGDFEVGGDNRVVNRFANRLKQIYALEAIKDNMPLDFEVVEEEETGGEIHILLKG
jgi:hypothetical protein